MAAVRLEHMLWAQKKKKKKKKKDNLDSSLLSIHVVSSRSVETIHEISKKMYQRSYQERWNSRMASFTNIEATVYAVVW